jgi:hypothetical protein
MAKYETTTFSCDNCGKLLPTCQNKVEIVTSKSENSFWRRLHVRIELKSGVNNNGTTEDADLCKACAIKLLEDAAARVKKDERLTAGVEHAEQSKWE